MKQGRGSNTKTATKENEEEDLVLLDFKPSPRFKCLMFSFGLFPGVWILIANVSEHSVPTK
jgi:hypothetical protein